MENHKVVDKLEGALDLWEKGFNVIPLRSSNPLPTPEEPSEDFSILKKLWSSGKNIIIKDSVLKN